MRKALTLAAILAGLAAAVPDPAAAQLRPFRIGLSGGPSTPTGDLGDVAGAGFNAMASLAINIPLFPFGLRGDLLFQQFGDEEGGSIRQVGGMGNVSVGLPLPLIRPYLLGGVGMVNNRLPDDHAGHEHPEGGSENAWQAGVGLQFGLLGLGGFAEARFLNAGGGYRSIPLTVGILF